jgi:polyhydroxybutyrate depolymerase
VAPYRAWRAVAEANNLLLMVPQGIDDPDGHAGWNDCRADAGGHPDTDDVGFVRAALAQLGETHRVDADRIYAMGTSNGGHMAIRLAQEAPNIVAGIGVIAAGMPANSSCADSVVPVSALFMWGTDDPLAPYDGGAMAGDRGDILSADASIEYWINRNLTAATPAVTAHPDLDADDQSTVERDVYVGGADDTRVALYRIVGGGHMADEMWSFFDGRR